MKNTILIILLTLILPMTTQAQRSVNRFIDKYYAKDDVTTIELSGPLLKMAARFADKKGGVKILSTISRLQVMVMDGQNHVDNADLKKFKARVVKDNFEQLMYVRNGSTQVDFYVKEKKGAISNILVIVKEADNFILLNLKGKLKFEDLQKLDFDVKGGDQFKKIPKKKKDVPRA